jgi:hypothetical protein
MNPILGVGLVLGITGLAVWAVWKWRALLAGHVAGWGGPDSPDGESSDPGWSDPLDVVHTDCGAGGGYD